MSLNWIRVTGDRSRSLQELAQQAVGVLVAATLRGCVRISKPNIKVQALGEFDETGHSPAAVVSHALPQKGRQPSHLASETFKSILGRAAVHSAQHDIARLALHEHTHAGTIERRLPQGDCLRGVNRLVANALVGVAGMRAAQSESNPLWRRTPIIQMVIGILIQRGVESYITPTRATLITNAVRRRRSTGMVAQHCHVSVARQLARDRRSAVPKQT